MSSPNTSSNTSTDTILTFNPYLIYGTCQDREDNIYQTITIGNQTWMAENLKTSHFNNEDTINTTETPFKEIKNDTASAYQWACNADKKKLVTYGRLYTWYTIMDKRGICPVGWHIPSDTEWKELINFLGGMSSIIGGKLKEVQTSHWYSPNTGADNSTGFTAVPGGFRESNGVFQNFGMYGYWWTSTKSDTLNAYNYNIGNHDPMLNRNSDSKSRGYSVRCILD